MLIDLPYISTNCHYFIRIINANKIYSSEGFVIEDFK
ncbi:MAG: hypothetical protein ACI9V1_000489 [Spirosomataceae bacterium]|jgi:hypothetical protein